MPRLSPQEKARRRQFRRKTRLVREAAFVELLSGTDVNDVIKQLRGLILMAATEANATPSEMVHINRAMAVLFGTLRFVGLLTGMGRGR